MTPTPEDIALNEELCHVYQKPQALELIAAHTAPLRELAEIGRLTVERRRAASAYTAELIAQGEDNCSSKAFGVWLELSNQCRDAVDAYVAKHPAP